MIRTASLTKALNSCQKTADKIENKIKTNKNRELRENKQRIINKIRRNSEKPIDRFSEKVYCEYNNSKGERNMSTIQDVAQKAGVSVSTVYKVFSDSYKTRDEIRERVLKACDELNYSHHSIIKKRKLLGMMFSEVTNPFTNTLMQMIIDELGDEYDIVTLFSNEDLTREKQNITCLEQMKVDALIFATFSNQEYPEINKMISDGKPVIQFFMQTHPGADAILFDDELGTYQAVKYLIQNGHKDILMLYKYRIGFPQRSNGYRKAFEEAGLEVDDRYLYDIPYNDSIRGVIQNKIQELKPSAILAVNEIIATSTVCALKEMKLMVPQDISLIIYDDLPWAAASKLTTIGHAFDSAGSLCKNILMEITGLEKKHTPVRLVIDPMLIVRDSVRILTT